MLRRVEMTQKAQKKKTKGIYSIPFSKHCIVKDGYSIPISIRVVVPPNGGSILIKDEGILSLSGNGSISVDVGLEDILHMVSVPGLFYRPTGLTTLLTKRKRYKKYVYKTRTEYKTIVEKPKEKKRKQVTGIRLTGKGADKASLLRDTLRNRSTTDRKNIVTSRDRFDTIVVQKEENLPKLTLAEMGVTFADGGDSNNISQRYAELSQFISERKRNQGEEKDD